jgi:hypothetical protein
MYRKICSVDHNHRSSLVRNNLEMAGFGCALSEHQILELSKGIREAQYSKDSGRAQTLINSFDQVQFIYFMLRETAHNLLTRQ